MKPRLLVLVLAFMTILPVLPSRSARSAATGSNFTAMAGHSVIGGYCEDGTPGCLPGDPGTMRAAPPNRGTPVSAKPSPNSGSTAKIIAFELLRWIVGTF
jgi:hypothetical protein